MGDLTARLRMASNAVYLACPGPVADDLNEMLLAAAGRLVELEAEVAALEVDVAALDELNSTLEAECDRLERERHHWHHATSMLHAKASLAERGIDLLGQREPCGDGCHLCALRPVVRLPGGGAR